MNEYKGREQTVALFREYPLCEQTFEHLVLFLSAKEGCLKDSSVENRVKMKDAYMNIYMDIKHAWVARQISKLDFLNLDEVLQEGL